MIPKQNQEEFYSRFLKQLKFSQEWPGKFMFKFILRPNSKNIDQLKFFFKNKSPIYKLKNSTKNKFQSITITVEMNSAIEVIEIYKKASDIDGVISL
tara:strand:- start:476 stop:766 length:291 start_codon:yes stop_codon:yes gene_type:complete